MGQLPRCLRWDRRCYRAHALCAMRYMARGTWHAICYIRLWRVSVCHIRQWPFGRYYLRCLNVGARGGVVCYVSTTGATSSAVLSTTLSGPRASTKATLWSRLGTHDANVQDRSVQSAESSIPAIVYNVQACPALEHVDIDKLECPCQIGAITWSNLVY